MSAPQPAAALLDAVDDDRDFAAELDAERRVTLRDCLRTIEDIVEALDDPTLDAAVTETLSTALIGAIAGTKDKVDRCGGVFAMYEGIEAAIEAELTRLNERLAWARRQRQRLTDYIVAVLTASNLTKLEGLTTRFELRKNPPRVEIADGAAIPDAYLVYPPAPAPRPNKDALKRALKAGEAIAGVELRQATRLMRS